MYWQRRGSSLYNRIVNFEQNVLAEKRKNSIVRNDLDTKLLEKMVDKEKRKSSGCEEYVEKSSRESERKIVERTRSIA